MSDIIYNMQQKSCQTINCLIMKEKSKKGGAKKCAKSHVLRAESHSQHNANVKKDLFWGNLY